MMVIPFDVGSGDVFPLSSTKHLEQQADLESIGSDSRFRIPDKVTLKVQTTVELSRCTDISRSGRSYMFECLFTACG